MPRITAIPYRTDDHGSFTEQQVGLCFVELLPGVYNKKVSPALLFKAAHRGAARAHDAGSGRVEMR